MPSVTFNIRNKQNKGLVINDRELLTLYFYGIDIVNQQYTGISSQTLETVIRTAQEEMENYFSIKLVKQSIEETSDYYRQEFQGVGMIKTKFPVNYPYQCDGYIGSWKQISYPKEWLICNKTAGRGTNRQVHVVPNSNVNTVSINAGIFAGNVLPHLGLVNATSIAGYWHMGYITGFEIGQ
jgi:hypothetical protein